MKRWLADHIWLVFWIVCLSQAALWAWWLTFAAEHAPQRIEPKRVEPTSSRINQADPASS